jgi:hypothetical protein
VNRKKLNMKKANMKLTIPCLVLALGSACQKSQVGVAGTPDAAAALSPDALNAPNAPDAPGGIDDVTLLGEGAPPALVCPAGQPAVAFNISAPLDEDDLTDTFVNGREPMPFSMKLEFGICGESDLARVLYRADFETAWRIKGAALQSEHLDAALFGVGEINQFKAKATFPNGELVFSGLGKTQVGNVIVGFDVSGSGESIRKFYGALELGASFTQCDGGDPVHARATFGQVELVTSYCPGFGTSGGFGGRVFAYRLRDDSAGAGAMRGQTVNIAALDFPALVNQKIHHHNVCDSIRFQLPHANYSLTASAGAGVGGSDEIAANCSPGNGNFVPNLPIAGEDSTAFEIKYPNAVPTSGKIPNLSHWVKDNPDHLEN